MTKLEERFMSHTTREVGLRTCISQKNLAFLLFHTRVKEVSSWRKLYGRTTNAFLFSSSSGPKKIVEIPRHWNDKETSCNYSVAKKCLLSTLRQ